MPSQEDQTEWQKMIREILAAKDLKYGCRLTDWELNRLEEWRELTVLSDKQGKIIERIYQEKM